MTGKVPEQIVASGKSGRPTSSDRTNISRAGIRVTWVIFQETPTIRIDFKHVWRR